VAPEKSPPRESLAATYAMGEREKEGWEREKHL